MKFHLILFTLLIGHVSKCNVIFGCENKCIYIFLAALQNFQNKFIFLANSFEGLSTKMAPQHIYRRRKKKNKMTLRLHWDYWISLKHVNMEPNFRCHLIFNGENTLQFWHDSPLNNMSHYMPDCICLSHDLQNIYLLEVAKKKKIINVKNIWIINSANQEAHIKIWLINI